MAKILILIGGHLCNAPRPQKEADTLAQAGHDVSVAGFWFDPEFVKRDRQLLKTTPWQFQPIVDFQPHHRFTNLWIRAQGRITKKCYQRFQIFSPNLLGFSAKAMLKVAHQFQADLTIVHSELGLWVGNQLLHEGFRVGVDFEDWFSEDLLPEARLARPIAQLKALEQHLMQTCQYCLTTSHAMAEAMAIAYHAPSPTVIYNAFPWADRAELDGQIKDRRNLKLPSLHWFSQTIGPGRGVETLLQALPHLKTPAEVHLRGNYPDSSRQWLEPLIPKEWRDRLFIHPTVSNAELLSRIAEHDIGLALEIPYCSNKQFTASNKLFQYMQAGLAVIATDTTGQQEILKQFPAVGEVIPHQNAIALANALNTFLNNPQRLKTAKTTALKAASALSWEQQENRLLRLVEQALENSPLAQISVKK
jgi:glycosyltransferase involved in cell wall biosynthesis